MEQPEVGEAFRCASWVQIVDGAKLVVLVEIDCLRIDNFTL